MENTNRKIVRVVEPEPVLEGAGVRLKRSIAGRELNYVDPFLLFDDFSSDNPDDFIAGFPMHPHRGIETVTYIIKGKVNHKDTLGNSGSIGTGDVQWMTAGGGIMHEEMPQPVPGGMTGFQLWVNLPAKDKMMKPRYQDVLEKDIPVVKRPDGIEIKVIAGEIDGVQGSVRDIIADPVYLDVNMPSKANFEYSLPQDHAVITYVFEGTCVFGGEHIHSPKLVVLGEGNSISVSTDENSGRFLLMSGKPINEPIARYGPFVMNTQAEIQQALSDLRNGTFVH
jgi:quercetin 2,3-dioxygenase